MPFALITHHLGSSSGYEVVGPYETEAAAKAGRDEIHAIEKRFQKANPRLHVSPWRLEHVAKAETHKQVTARLTRLAEEAEVE